jgi:hypothetical protein
MSDENNDECEPTADYGYCAVCGMELSADAMLEPCFSCGHIND